MSKDRGIDKMWYMDAMEYYSAIKNRLTPFGAKWMDTEIVILSDISVIKGKANTILNCV